HQFLEATQLPPPYILVGHSLGGLVLTKYTSQHPEHVAGLILLDPTHQDQVKKLPTPPKLPMAIASHLPRAAALGLPQLTMKGANEVVRQAKHVRTAGAEMRGFLREGRGNDASAQEFGNIPMLVLTAGDYSRLPFETEEQKREIWEIW